MFDVLIASQMFHPDIAATAKVMTDLALDISEKGYSVNAICQNRAYNDPDEKYFYHEQIQGVTVNRFSVPRINKNSLIGRAYLSYLVEKRSVSLVRKNAARLYMAVSNPPNMALGIARYASEHKKPFVYILHDLYPDVLVKTGRLNSSSAVARKMRKMSEETFSRSTKTVVLGRDAADYLVKEYRTPFDKIEVITNWGPELNSHAYNEGNAFRTKHGLLDKFIVLYSGNIGETAELDTLLDTASLLEEIDNKIQFVIVGSGRYRNHVEQRSENLTNTMVLDLFPEIEYLQMMKEVDCFFVSLKKNLYGNSVPSKAYYYLSAAKPIVGLLPAKSEVSLMIEENNVGLVCSDYRPETLKDVFLKLKNSPELAREMTSNAAKCFKESYSRRKVTRKYIELIQEVVR